MASVALAVERARATGTVPKASGASLKEVDRRVQPSPAGSARALTEKVFGAATKHPWAILLCRFKGMHADPDIEAFYREIFAAGTGGLVEYWRDVSLGAIDVSGSTIFGWIELEITRQQAGGVGGEARRALLNHALHAAKRDRLPLDRFYSNLVVLTHRWSKDGISGEPNWLPDDPMKPFYEYWIEGSAVGRQVIQTPPFSGNVIAHEMGHGFDMGHDVGADMTTHYADPCCIMSQHNAFEHPEWNAYGPALCLPHLHQRGWMFSHRVHHDTTWWSKRETVTSPLAPTNDPGARANLGLRLATGPEVGGRDYFVEYVRPTAWNRGLPEPMVVVRRMDTVTGLGETPIYLGNVTLPVGDELHQFIDHGAGIDLRVHRFRGGDRQVTVEVRRVT